MGPVENQTRALAAQHYVELDLIGEAVGHTTRLFLFSVFFYLVFFLLIYFLFQLCSVMCAYVNKNKTNKHTK